VTIRWMLAFVFMGKSCHLVVRDQHQIRAQVQVSHSHRP
jgi:hypothetical protein